MKNAAKHAINGFIYGDIFLSSLVIILGVVMLTFTEVVMQVIPYMIIFSFLTKMLSVLFIALPHPDKRNLIIGSIDLVITATLCALTIIYRDNGVDFVAIFMAVSCILETMEGTEEAIEGVREKDHRKTIYFTLESVIHALFALELLTSLSEGVEGHVIMYGIIFIGKGTFALIRDRIEYIKTHKDSGHHIIMDVVRDTYGVELAAGMVALIILSSMIMSHIEPNMHEFGDAVWYCFGLVTTINVGDVVAETTIGRLLSVLLGIYGIFMVGLVTATLVNIYKEVREFKRERMAERAERFEEMLQEVAAAEMGKPEEKEE